MSDTRNDIHICMEQFLAAASEVHTAMCRLDPDNGCQELLSSALHSILIGAQQCRQALGKS